MAYLHTLCQQEGMSSSVYEALSKGISPETLSSYSRLWKGFVEWLGKRESVPYLSPQLVCDYLLSKFNDGSSTSSVNTIRSSINFFTLNFLDLENNIFVKKIFKFFYRSKPLKPRYTTFWPVNKVLDFLKNWYPIEDLSLKDLTLKTIALVALTSSDRGQTLHLASVENMEVLPDKILFVIRERVKNTRKVLKPTIITCISSDITELDVALHVSKYIERTSEFRDEGGKLFLSWASKKPVTKQTLARWLKIVLHLAGIDTNTFKAHSYRGAGLSKAYQKGASIEQVVAAGNWANSQIFQSYYNAPSYETPIGALILED